MLLAQQALLEASDFRGQPRRTLRLAVDTSLNGDRFSTATIRNMSETGLLLETDIELPIGEWIGVDLPGSGSRSAQVVWASEDLVGCRFCERVTPAAVSAALLRSPFDPAGPTTQELPLMTDRAASRPDKLPLGARVLVIAGLTSGLWVVIGGFVLLIVA